MNKLLGGVVLAGLVLTCVGCITPTPHAAKTPTAPLNVIQPAPPGVTPEQVTPATAHRIVRDLAEEMERDMQEAKSKTNAVQ